MTLVLSHISALEYWRSTRTSGRVYKTISHARNLITSSPSLELDGSHDPFWLSRPLHVLVGVRSFRRSTHTIETHLWSSPLLKGDVLKANDELYVSSPEFCFLQMAAYMNLVELIELGFEFCGTYGKSDNTLENCTPLTTSRKLSSFLEKASKHRGSKQALRAVRHVIDGSASPMETVLTMLFCLPYRLGGYGLPKPLINRRIDMTAETSLSRSYYVCDLYWPESRLAVEYDSDSFHSGTEKLTRDSIRRGDLASAGVTVITVTRQQLMSSLDLHQLAQTVARHIGHRFRYEESRFLDERGHLRQALLGKRRF